MLPRPTAWSLDRVSLGFIPLEVAITTSYAALVEAQKNRQVTVGYGQAKNSPVKTVADINGKDFSFVDPASTSGNLFPRVMLKEAGIDPNTDSKGQVAEGDLVILKTSPDIPNGPFAVHPQLDARAKTIGLEFDEKGNPKPIGG